MRLIAKSLFIFFISIVVLSIYGCKKDEKQDQQPETTVKDAEGNIYNTVTIGNQIWMVENLKTNHYNNNDLIGTIIPDSSLSITNPKFQWAYDCNDSNVTTYGRLYTWYAITDSRGVCPNGMHVPSDIEWQILSDFLGGDNVAGGKMKEAGYTHWIIPNSGADNSSGFKALPAGKLYFYIENYNPYIEFRNLSEGTLFWSSTEIDQAHAINRGLWVTNAVLTRENGSSANSFKHGGASVRCVKNKE